MNNSWPAHGAEALEWRQAVRGGTKADRMLRSVEAAIPPNIADEIFSPTPEVVRVTEGAAVAIQRADSAASVQSAAISQFMLRTESVASSKIERINASIGDYAKALAGSRGNPSASSMVAASKAMQSLIAQAGTTKTISLEMILHAHRELMADDPYEAAFAGRTRDMQNWIGGSDFSPRDALYIPPAENRVQALLDDLIVYVNRDDIPVIVQAAIAHAQFESIHAFTDGNGRIGRALVGAIVRRRDISAHTVVPLASGILAKRDGYFEALTSYRVGNPEPIVRLFAEAAQAGADEAVVTAARLRELPNAWREEYFSRAGSAGARLLNLFFDHPVMSSAEIEDLGIGVASSVNAALDAMQSAGIVEEITGRTRNRAWAAGAILAELEDLDRRIQQRMK